MVSSDFPNSIAWLLPIPQCTLDTALRSNLASVRLRVALSAEKFIAQGCRVDFCDGNKNIIPEILFIGKFNHSTDEERFDRWISYINLCKANGTMIVVDYTDNHAYSTTVTGDFYTQAIALADKIICSSKRLAQHIQTLGYDKSIIIEDPVEYSLLKPTNKQNTIKRALWFGHASNLQYFLNFLIELQNYPIPLEIVALTNAYPLPEEIISKLRKILPTNVNVNLLEWSHQNMIEAAKISDFCIIPAGINDAKKNGASSNRLLTALTLGLPVLADPLDSYLDFKNFFNELTLDNLTSLVGTPMDENLQNVMLAQSQIISKFTKDRISNKWINLISTLNDKPIRNNYTQEKQMKDDAADLFECWENSPYPSTKLNTYFSAYAELFSEYRNTNCVFIETGILGGGSLFMWRKWLGPSARIIGVDLNPEANKWIEHGFEIYIGDQGDPEFWKKTLDHIGEFDVLLDDGGHQSFQQIVTASEAIRQAKKKCIVAVEDTQTSFMSDFNAHGKNTFLNYAKDSTDILTAKGYGMYPTRMTAPSNNEIIDLFKNVHSIQFFNSLVAFKIVPSNTVPPSVIWNKQDYVPTDFRYHGKNDALTLWPNPFETRLVAIIGGATIKSTS